jgi:hypothetical protein
MMLQHMLTTTRCTHYYCLHRAHVQAAEVDKQALCIAVNALDQYTHVRGLHPRVAAESMLEELWNRNNPPPRFTDVVIKNPAPKRRSAAVTEKLAAAAAAAAAGTSAAGTAAAAVQDTVEEVRHTHHLCVHACTYTIPLLLYRQCYHSVAS